MVAYPVRVASVLVGGVLAVSVAGCGGGGPAPAADGRITVVASTDVWGSVVSAVGGNHVQVSSVIDSPEKDPHDYESSAADAARIGRAQLTIANGGGYDDFFTKAVDAADARARNVTAFAVSGKHGDDVNEHVFFDLPTVRKVATAVAGALGRLDPGHAKEYTANADTFDAKVDGLLAKAQAIGRGKHLAAVATESVADYLLAAANVREATPPAYADAVEKDTDIPAAAIAQTGALISGRKVQLLIDNTQTESDTANQLRDKAKQAGIPVVRVTETFPAGVTDYLQWMGNEINELTTAAAGAQ